MRVTFCKLLAFGLFASGCCCTDEATVQGVPAAPMPVHAAQADPAASVPMPANIADPDTATLVEMRNIHFRVDPRLALDIRSLKGHMQPLPGYQVIDFGDSESFEIGIAHADIGMSMGNLAYLLKQYVFGYQGSPLTIGEVEAAGTAIRQTGTLHNVVDIPFEMTAEVSVNADGRIRLHPTSMLICAIPGQGLMRALDIELEDLLDLSGARGVVVEGNDLLMDPEALLPPPQIRGRLSAVRIEDGQLIQEFGRAEDAPEIPPTSVADAANYMFYSGGTLRFGKLYMVDADLQIIDDDSADPFDFFLGDYMLQLAAGSSRTMSDAGLAAHFPDYDDIEQTTP